MKKKHFDIVIILLFIFLASLEIGIFIEVLWHGWGGYGDISMEYTTIGQIGIGFLIYFIPLSVIVLFINCITMYIKNIISKKELLYNCICALFGVCIAIGIFFAVPNSPIFWFGKLIAAFFIDCYNWMRYPMP